MKQVTKMLVGATVVFSLSSGDLKAQSSPVTLGSWIRVSAPQVTKANGELMALEQPIECQVERRTADSLYVVEAVSNEPISVALSDIEWIRVRQRTRKAGTGATIGAPILGGFGLIGGIACATSDGFYSCSAGQAVLGTLLSTALGATMGGLIGLAFHSDRWEEVGLEGPRVGLMPTRTGVALSFAYPLRF